MPLYITICNPCNRQSVFVLLIHFTCLRNANDDSDWFFAIRGGDKRARRESIEEPEVEEKRKREKEKRERGTRRWRRWGRQRKNHCNIAQIFNWWIFDAFLPHKKAIMSLKLSDHKVYGKFIPKSIGQRYFLLISMPAGIIIIEQLDNKWNLCNKHIYYYWQIGFDGGDDFFGSYVLVVFTLAEGGYSLLNTILLGLMSVK